MEEVAPKNRETQEELIVKQLVHSYKLREVEIEASRSQEWRLSEAKMEEVALHVGWLWAFTCIMTFRRMVHIETERWESGFSHRKALGNKRASYSKAKQIVLKEIHPYDNVWKGVNEGLISLKSETTSIHSNVPFFSLKATGQRR